MTETLRPMSLGEILDRAVQMLKAHFPVFVGIAAIPALATLVYSLRQIQTATRWRDTRFPRGSDSSG
jgi:hypothetical protein